MTESQQRPQRLFRYFSPRHSTLFADRKLWFSAAKDFNDIFEVLPRFDSLVPKMVEHAVRVNFAFTHPASGIEWDDYHRQSQKTAQELIEECNETLPRGLQLKFSEHFGVLCFSENLDSLLMWGHYTNCHRGFVVEFNPEHPLFCVRDFGKIHYSPTRPSVEIKQMMLLMKSPEWQYEAEHRLIKPCHELTPESVFLDGTNQIKHYLQLPMEAVKAVYFGCRISPRDRDKLLTPLSSFPNIQVFFMRQNDIAYKLDAVPWKLWKEPKVDAMEDFKVLWKNIGL